MKTYSARASDVRREWFIIDASDLVLGRMATEIASRLRGKHKPEFTPHVDTGDYIVVINAEKVRVTGRKEEDKLYHRHSQQPGGLTTLNLRQMREKHPERVIELAVKRMLPRNPLGRQMFRKLKVYAGPEHGHTAQQPKPLEI